MFRIKNYSCRFSPDTHRMVYSVIIPSHTYRKEAILSVPFYNKHTHDDTNAIIAFTCPDIAKTHATKIGSIVREECLQDLVDFSAILKLPVVLMLNGECCIEEKHENYEIVYIDPKTSALFLNAFRKKICHD